MVKSLNILLTFWRKLLDSNSRRALTLDSFQDCCIQPLCQASLIEKYLLFVTAGIITVKHLQLENAKQMINLVQKTSMFHFVKPHQ